MNVIYSVKDYVTNVFEVHQDAVSGAIDVVAVRQEDGALRCSPFHVHFGRLNTLKKNAGKQVAIEVNGRVVDGVRMKLGAAGEAYFLEETQEPVEEEDYSTSPLPSPVAQEVTAATSATLLAGQSEHVPLDTEEQPEDEQQVGSERPGGPTEWHDAYRLVSEPRATVTRSESNDRLTWGFGSLPIVRSSTLDLESLAAEGDSEDELPMMVKSDSVYFDAVDTELPTAATEFLAIPSASGADTSAMSLCGHLLEHAETQEERRRVFLEHQVTLGSFSANPVTILADPRLRFLVDGQVTAYDAQLQAHLVARVLFPTAARLPVSSSGVNMPAMIGSDACEGSSGVGPSCKNGRSAGIGMGNKEEEKEDDVADCQRSRERSDSYTARAPLLGASTALEPVEETPSEGAASTLDTTGSDTGATFFRKSLQPSQEELRRMELHVGTNEIAFVLRSQASAANADDLARVTAKLYVWPVASKLVVAQLDGAISRNAAPGGMFKRRDSGALHPGAVAFYSKLERNGYRLVYLTNHGLSQSELRHSVLRHGDEMESAVMPSGPVLLSPDRLLLSASNEAIDAPEFKVAALDALRTLFPTEVNPFYAGFGTTSADSEAFAQAGVFPGKVFTVDEADGSLRHRAMRGFHESYDSLITRVDAMFPPVYSPTGTSVTPSVAPLAVPPMPQSTASSRSANTAETAAGDGQEHIRSRSLVDEAYNEVNFWRIQPGSLLD